MESDSELYQLAERVAQKLRAAERRLATTESCADGWAAKAFTEILRSLQWFECTYVTHSSAAKLAAPRLKPPALDIPHACGCGSESEPPRFFGQFESAGRLLREILRRLGMQSLCLTLHEPGQRGMVECDIGQAGTQISRLHVRS
jgi:hypothetical protein